MEKVLNDTFFSSKNKRVIYEQRLPQFYQGTGTHWKIEMRQTKTTNETEDNEKSVDCNLFTGLVHTRIFQNFTLSLYKNCSRCQGEWMINSGQKKIREEKDRLKGLLSCYCRATIFTFHITAYSDICCINDRNS